MTQLKRATIGTRIFYCSFQHHHMLKSQDEIHMNFTRSALIKRYLMLNLENYRETNMVKTMVDMFATMLLHFIALHYYF